jgi:DNA polymerase
MGTDAPVPATRDLVRLAEAVGDCTACDLHRRATQAVFGRGPAAARLMVVGEQPGDREDIEGRAFVGPAGALLERALAAAGLPREDLYLTNAVKHFKWERRGTRRLHKAPSARERTACRPWLLAELEAVAPILVVALGASAAQALLGPGFRLTAHRGEILPGPGGVPVTTTLHPAAVLRTRPQEERHRAFSALVDDLTRSGQAALGPGRGTVVVSPAR